jgi:hypothetical protein
MPTNPKSNNFIMTDTEYLEFERNSDIKPGYYQSEVFAMAGASPNHNRLTVKLLHLIDIHLDRTGCEAFGGDLLVKMYMPMLCLRLMIRNSKI